MPVEIVEGDLLDQDVDAVVNAWNRNTIPWWLLLPQGVSGAIKRRAGVAPFAELRKHGRMKLGEAIATNPGRLPYRAIIHVAGINDLWRATEASVRDSTRNALALAESMGIRSIAFPILGAGSGGMNTDRAEDLMRREAEDFADRLRIVFVRYRKPGFGQFS